MYKIYKTDIFSNLQFFDNKLILSRVSSCQLRISVFWCYTFKSSHFICFCRVVYVGSVDKYWVLLHNDLSELVL